VRENQSLTKKNTANKGFIKLLLVKKFSVFLIVFLIFNIFFASAPVVYAKDGGIGDIEKEERKDEGKIKLFFLRIFNFDFSGKDDGEETPRASAATMPLLEAFKNPDIAANQVFGDINIVNNNSLLPSAGPLGTTLDVQNAPSTQISIYTVRKGDTLSGIAGMFNVDASTVRFANDLKKGEGLKIGQQLVILPISGIRYTVKKGDTVKSIAKKLGGDEDEIMTFNDIDSSNGLTVGEIIIIPNGEATDEESGDVKQGSGLNQGKNNGYVNKYPSYSGYYMRPIVNGYRSQGIHGHNGVDLATSCGSPVYAAADGEVIISRSSGWNGGYGKYIVIDHKNGTQTLYGHNSLNTVSVGDDVSKGEIIAYIGATGRSTGCHIHFEIRGARNPF